MKMEMMIEDEELIVDTTGDISSLFVFVFIFGCYPLFFPSPPPFLMKMEMEIEDED
jgi:hypothetical protein